jgi:hypothetical protein
VLLSWRRRRPAVRADVHGKKSAIVALSPVHSPRRGAGLAPAPLPFPAGGSYRRRSRCRDRRTGAPRGRQHAGASSIPVEGPGAGHDGALQHHPGVHRLPGRVDRAHHHGAGRGTTNCAVSYPRSTVSDQLGSDGDFLLTAAAVAELSAKYFDLWQAYRSQAWCKGGIQQSGLCLLIAWRLTILGDIEFWGRAPEADAPDNRWRLPVVVVPWRSVVSSNGKKRPN